MKFHIFSLLVFLSVFSIAQTEPTSSFSLGIESNAQYYLDDKVTGDFLENNPFRSNNYIKADYSINQFSFGLQVESYAPQALLNYSPKYDDEVNVGTYYAQFMSKNWEVTLGYFYEQFGNGMMLRTWEDRQLGINNALRGIRLKYKPTENTTLTGLWGQQRVGFEVSNGKIIGVDFSMEFPQLFQKDNISGNAGISFVNRYEPYHTSFAEYFPSTTAYGGRLGLNIHDFYTQIEGVVKTKDVLVQNGILYDNALFYGGGLQLNMGYTQKGFGVNTTLRRVENMSFFSDRAATGNLYLEQNLNYLPALTKQHDYTLSNMYVYQAQPFINFGENNKAGELGGQVDVFYQFKKESPLGGKYGTKVSVNYATWHGLKADFIENYNRLNVSDVGLGEHYFSDLSVEVRKKLSENVSGIVTYIHGNYNKKYIEETYDFVHYNIAVAESTIKTGELSSFRVEAQHLWTPEDQKNWAAGTLEYYFNSNLSLFANDQYNYGNPLTKNHYYVVGGSYSKNRTRVGLSYGRQRGGVLCVGGVCREVPAATGLTMNVTTSF